jgi:hypothetical protein
MCVVKQQKLPFCVAQSISSSYENLQYSTYRIMYTFKCFFRFSLKFPNYISEILKTSGSLELEVQNVPPIKNNQRLCFLL